MRALILLCLVVSANACGAQEPTTTSRPDTDLAAATARLDRALARHVRDESIDYLALRDASWDDLTAFLAAVPAIDQEHLPTRQRLAFLINVYNATMIEVICRRHRPGFTTADDDWGVFDEKLVRLADGVVSLNHLEHEIIRKQFDEPRIHVALVCGARSCPPILPRAYRGDDLDQTLEDGMRAFVRDRARNRLTEDRWSLSRIFEWYAEDFGGTDGVVAYVARYAGAAPVERIDYLDYSWDLNIATPAGRWVATTADVDLPGGRKLPTGRVVRVIGANGDELEVSLPFGEGRARIPAARTAAFQ